MARDWPPGEFRAVRLVALATKIEPELKRMFEAQAGKEGRTPSALLAGLVRRYLLSKGLTLPG